MAKITLSWIPTWLTVSFILINNTTEVVDFSWVGNEIATSGSYVYTFTEAATTDYTYVATFAIGWVTKTMSGVIYQDSAAWWGWLTAPQAAQLAATVKKWDTLLNLWDIILPL